MHNIISRAQLSWFCQLKTCHTNTKISHHTTSFLLKFLPLTQHVFGWGISRVFVYLITCELRLHLCLMSEPDSKDWVILSLRLVRGTGRAGQGEVFRHDTVVWTHSCGFCSRARVAAPLKSQILQRNALRTPEGGCTVHTIFFQCE